MRMLQRYFIELAYKGTAYHGWQIQPNALAVQEVLNKALATVFRKDIETLGCGRTDTGVHASQFYAHFDIHTENTDGICHPNLIRSINGLLPNDIAVKQIIKVDSTAHARFDATLRKYHYYIHFNKNPFKTETSWLIKDDLDFVAMNKAASILLDYEDFSAFCKANADNFTNNCILSQCEWKVENDHWVLHIAANRFLRNMVRAIVGTLVDIGKGKMGAEQIRKIVESKNRSNAGASVPACGLFLTHVQYPYIHG